MKIWNSSHVLDNGRDVVKDIMAYMPVIYSKHIFMRTQTS